MSIEKRIRLLTFLAVAFSFVEVCLAVLNLLTGYTLTHVALVYGSQLVIFDWIILSARNRFKRELKS
jgi:hypothetical protein